MYVSFSAESVRQVNDFIQKDLTAVYSAQRKKKKKESSLFA